MASTFRAPFLPRDTTMACGMNMGAALCVNCSGGSPLALLQHRFTVASNRRDALAGFCGYALTHRVTRTFCNTRCFAYVRLTTARSSPATPHAGRLRSSCYTRRDTCPPAIKDGGAGWRASRRRTINTISPCTISCLSAALYLGSAYRASLCRSVTSFLDNDHIPLPLSRLGWALHGISLNIALHAHHAGVAWTLQRITPRTPHCAPHMQFLSTARQ